jgi:hypothetical protein
MAKPVNSDSKVTWVLEPGVFPHGDCLLDAARDAGQPIRAWDDAWWAAGSMPTFSGPVVFHGSLGTADRIRRELPWRPGAYCNTSAFLCSVWYPPLQPFLLNSQWEVLPASDLIKNSSEVLDRIGAGDTFFVRPDGPLKQFSGRVLRRDQLSFRALDHGFYYDDIHLPVVVAPVRPVSREWRFVVVDGVVVAGTGYLAESRTAVSQDSSGEPWRFARRACASFIPPTRFLFSTFANQMGGFYCSNSTRLAAQTFTPPAETPSSAQFRTYCRFKSLKRHI